MKILIIAQGRSGGNSILKGLAKSLDVTPVWTQALDEPNFPHQNFKTILEQEKFVLKIHDFQKSDFFDDNFSFLNYCNANFDHIIFHARANVLDVGLSLENGFSIKDFKWTQTKYTPIKDRPELHRVEFACNSINNILKYANFLQKDVTFYEELFSRDTELVKNTIKRWGIDINLLSLDIMLHYLDPQFKYTN